MLVLCRAPRGNNLQSVDVLEVPVGLLHLRHRRLGLGEIDSLINSTLYPAVAATELYMAPPLSARLDLRVDHRRHRQHIDKVYRYRPEAPIGRTPRSNPATYTGTLHACAGTVRRTRQEARVPGLQARQVQSFNVKGRPLRGLPG